MTSEPNENLPSDNYQPITTTKESKVSKNIPVYMTRVFEAECASAKFGNIPIYQPAFFCTSCLGNAPICEKCFLFCHDNCNKNIELNGQPCYFVCACAEKLKHLSGKKDNINDAKVEETNAKEAFKIIIEKNEKADSVWFSTLLRKFIPEIEPYLKLSRPEQSLDERVNVNYYFPNVSKIAFNFIDFCDYEQIFQFLNSKYLMKEFSPELLNVVDYLCEALEGSFYSHYCSFLKSLSPDSFERCSIGELLYYKESLPTQNAFSEQVFNKYINNGVINTLINLFSNLFETVMSIRKKMRPDRFISYIIFCYSTCQFMLFNKETIVLAVNTLYNNFNEYKRLLIEAETVKDTFPLMCDLLFMLARTHDVLIAEDFIKEGKSETNSIFYNNETGNKIMIMLIQLLHTNKEVKELEIYNSYYSSLFKKVVNTFFFPYKNHKREFDDSFYNKKLMISDNKDNSDKYKKCVQLAERLENSRLKCFGVDPYNEHKNEYYQEFLNTYKEVTQELKDYISSRLVYTYDINYRNQKHIKITKRIRKFFGDKGGECIQNAEDIIEELLNANIETILTKCLIQVFPSNKELIEVTNNILSIYLLTEKGAYYLLLGEPFQYLRTLLLSEIFSVYLPIYPSFVYVFRLYTMFPKKLIEEPITDRTVNITLDENHAELQSLSLKGLNRMNTNDSFSKEFYRRIINQLYDYLRKVKKDDFFWVIINKNKSQWSEQVKGKISGIFQYFDLISKYTIHFRRVFVRENKYLFNYFDHPDIKLLIKSPNLSITKKKIIIRTITLFWLGPLYNEDGSLLKPLTNDEYAAYMQISLNDSNNKFSCKRKRENDKCLPLEKISKELIEKKILHMEMIKKLIRIVIYQLKQISNIYKKNTKEYFANRKLYKTLIQTISIITLYIYSFENIANIIIFPFLKLVIHFVEKEMILLQYFDIKEEQPDNSILDLLNQSSFDCLNKEYIVKIMMKEIYKFSSLLQSKRFKSVFAMYFNQCDGNLFNNKESPFGFLSDLQDKDMEIDHLGLAYKPKNKNVTKYKKWLREQVDDISNYVFVNVMDTNPKLTTSYFREIFTEDFFFDFLAQRYQQGLTVINVLYKICSVNKDWVLSEFVRNTKYSKEDFFNELRRALRFFLVAQFNISKCYPNLEADSFYGYVVVSLIKLIEMFGEGYNFAFHEYILVQRGINSVLRFDYTLDEILDHKEKEQMETCEEFNEEKTKAKRKKLLKRQRRKMKKIQSVSESVVSAPPKEKEEEIELKSKKQLELKTKQSKEDTPIKAGTSEEIKEIESTYNDQEVSFHTESSVIYSDNDSNLADIPDDTNENLRSKKELTIFETIVILLDKSIKEIMKREKYDFENPFDNNFLIVVSAEIDFLIEFFYTVNTEHEHLIDIAMTWLFKYNLIQTDNGLSIFSLLQTNDCVNQRQLFFKGRLLDLINAYISSGDKSSLISFLIKSQTVELSTMGYFNQILLYFKSLLNYLHKDDNSHLSRKLKSLSNIQNEDAYTKKLLDIYIWEGEFRDSWQMKLILKYFKFIFLLESQYKMNHIQTYFEEKFDKDIVDEKWKWSKVEAKGVYNFLKGICIPIEMNYIMSSSEQEFIRMKEEENEENVEEKIIFKDESKGIVKLYKKIRSRQTQKEQSVDDLIKEKFARTYFIVPYYTFYLSNQSKLRFEENVDRSTKTTKARGLINSIESFLFEMNFNSYIFKNSWFSMIAKINYFHFEVINFLFICIHNVILLSHYYKSVTLPMSEYETYEYSNFNDLLDTKNWMFAIIQITFLVFVIGIWYKYNFLVCYFSNLQSEFENKTPLFTRIKKFREISKDDKPDFDKLLDEQFVDVPYRTKMRVAFIDSFLLNQEICFPIYTLFLLILYLIFQSPFFVILPMLFMAHLFNTLSAVFKGVYSRFGHLSAVYLFTFLVIYIFMWTGFLFFGHLFTVDTINSNNDPVNSEPFCASSIQCLLFFINYGIRSGGGIGDLLGTPSFKDNYIFFLIIFFYEIAFHLIIVMVFANVFLGLIADAFGELREVDCAKENDMKNICFICQIDTDTCAIKGIDFDEHTQKKHNIWNYVHFLCYLYMKDENEYNIMEYKIMTSINELNLSWLPFVGNNDDDDN